MSPAGSGDFNVDARADARVRDPRFPHVQMARHGLSTSWAKLGTPSVSTHRDRLIDYVWFTSNLTATQQRILPKYGSDHSAVTATLTGIRQPNSASVSTASRSATTRVSTQTGATTPRVNGLDTGQIRIAQQIYTTAQIGSERHWPTAKTNKAFQIAVAVAMQESSLGANPASKHPDRNGDLYPGTGSMARALEAPMLPLQTDARPALFDSAETQN